MAYPFTRDKLFGPQLDKILVETRDKKKLLPKSLRQTDRRGCQGFQPYNYSFHSSFLPSRTRQDRRQASGTPRPRFCRSSYNVRDNRTTFLRNQDCSFSQEGTGTPKQRKARLTGAAGGRQFD